MRKVDGEIRIVLIGHRGVGKTELLKRLQFFFPQFQYFDLDQEIAQKLSNPVYKIFETFGEEYFRSKEIELAHELLAKKNVIVSLGAGFRLESLPENVRCIWIRRITDAEGRIFLDRPTLNSKLTPLDDFLSRFSKRNKSYYDSADFIYDMPEGMQLFESKVVSKSGIRAKEKFF